MVFPIDYKKDIDSENKRDGNAEEIKEGEKQEDQHEAERGKQPLPSLPARKKVNQASADRNKGKQLVTQQVPPHPTFNRPKVRKEPVKSNIVVQTPTQTPTIVGPYGRQVGFCWDDGSHSAVRQIVIVASNRIESIHIEYDDDGASIWSQKHGGLAKSYQEKIRLDYPDEFLVSVSGYYDRNSTNILSLTFHSNVKFYGPYGVERGVYFTFPSTGGKIIGFHGRCNECLYALGAYYEPCRTYDKNNGLKSENFVKNGDVVGDRVEIPISVGPFGGNTGSPWNDGVYTTIRQFVVVSNNDSGVASIQIEYDKNGSSEWSEEHGEKGPYKINKVNLDYPNEFLIAISGFYSSEYVQGLTFQTNKKTYGPFGKARGKHFSTPSTGGKIVGFHGHCDANLISIGAYFEPIIYSYSAIDKPMSVGPFGGRGGSSFDDGTFTGIRELTIASGRYVDSISIEYDNNGCSVTSTLHGGRGGKNNTITLDYPDEFLISAWGYIYETDTLVIVRSLTLQSNRKTYGPYGIEYGKKFSFPSTGGKIIGFHGKSGKYLDAIGAYLEPTTHNPPSSKNPARLENVSEKASSSTNELDEHPSMPSSTDHDEPTERMSRPTIYGPYGGMNGKTFDDGVFTGVRAVHLTCSEALTSIKVLYDRGGQPVWGTKHGGSFLFRRSDKIEFDYPSEVLTHISGYYQSTTFKGPVAITSITLHTTKQTYGPYGTEKGDYFILGVGDGRIVGFHGRKGSFVNGIGVHILR